MFSTIFGIPAHPLFVHAAVVMIPLLALFAAVYALVPRWRDKVGWLAAGLAVVAPLVALATKLAGDDLLAARYAAGVPDNVLAHRSFGSTLLFVTIALGLATIVMLMSVGGRLSDSPDWLKTGSRVVVLILSAVAVYYAIRTGDSGAASVWGRT
ncbi:MAG: hypothetical protein HOV79_02655 [Hamadaea sp.]|nr:hypothetical protein [Hamadaea sp.]